MTSVSASNDLFQRAHAVFVRQGLMQHLGARLGRIGPGLCVVALPYSDRVSQQVSFQGGAMGALADIACGDAAMTTVTPERKVTTAEYKINFLAGFENDERVAIGRVVKAGKRIIVTSAEVMHHDATRHQSACDVVQQTGMPELKTD